MLSANIIFDFIYCLVDQNIEYKVILKTITII